MFLFDLTSSTRERKNYLVNYVFIPYNQPWRALIRWMMSAILIPIDEINTIESSSKKKTKGLLIYLCNIPYVMHRNTP